MVRGGMKYGILILLLCAVPLLCCRAPAFAAAPAGPAQTVTMIQRGIDAADLAMVERYLDIDAVAAKAASVAVTDENTLREAGKEPAVAALIALGAATGANDAIRDMLAAEAAEYVRHGVTSGAFAGSPKQDAPPYRGIFSKAFRGGAKDKQTFGPATVTSQNQDTARVVTSLRSGPKGTPQSLDLLLEKRNGVWRVMKVVNLPEILRKHLHGKKQ